MHLWCRVKPPWGTARHDRHRATRNSAPSVQQPRGLCVSICTGQVPNKQSRWNWCTLKHVYDLSTRRSDGIICYPWLTVLTFDANPGWLQYRRSCGISRALTEKPHPQTIDGWTWDFERSWDWGLAPRSALMKINMPVPKRAISKYIQNFEASSQTKILTLIFIGDWYLQTLALFKGNAKIKHERSYSSFSNQIKHEKQNRLDNSNATTHQTKRSLHNVFQNVFIYSVWLNMWSILSKVTMLQNSKYTFVWYMCNSKHIRPCQALIFVGQIQETRLHQKTTHCDSKKPWVSCFY